MERNFYGGEGPMVNAVLWVQTILLLFILASRLYTRIAILNCIGADDYLSIISVLLQVVYTAFVHVATGYGLGQLFAEVGNPEAYSTALMNEIFSQVAGLMMIGVGKCAVGAFLLRIVTNKYQIWTLWAFLVSTTFITLFSSITVVIQCLPPEKIWNQMVEGNCWLDFSKVGLTVGVWFVITDFAFAIFPWFILWNLNMKRKEKITVACGLSLGVMAGICGIVRTVALGGLNASEYIHDTVDMLIWSATENFVTILCSTIPVLRPLYVKIKYGSKGDSSNNTGENSSYNLPMYGNRSKSGTDSKFGHSSSVGAARSKGGVNITNNILSPTENASDESILRYSKAQGMMLDGGIKRTDEIAVTYEPHPR